MKVLLLSIVFLGVTLPGYVLFYRWDKAQNRGFEFGYYGVINKITNTLEAMPDVSAVTETAANFDIGLEEFSLRVRLKDGRTTSLDFLESDPVRSLSGKKLVASLRSLLVPEENGGKAGPGDPPRP